MEGPHALYVVTAVVVVGLIVWVAFVLSQPRGAQQQPTPEKQSPSQPPSPAEVEHGDAKN